jgi:hypothetical protein
MNKKQKGVRTLKTPEQLKMIKGSRQYVDQMLRTGDNYASNI